jgi:hypothetical protein
MKFFDRTLQMFFFAALLLLFADVVAQQTPNQLLQDVHGKMMKVQDYTVDAGIKADIPLIKILPVNAVIYFKQPDNIKLESKSIAIMPKQGFSDVAKIILDSTSYTAVAMGFETIGNLQTQIVSVIPSVDSGDLVLAKFWIDATASLILKSQLTTRSNGTMTVEYFYGAQAAFGLPDKMIFTVDVKKFKIPKALATDLHNQNKVPVGSEKKDRKGQIVINLQNYRINTGLKDSFF